MSKKLAKAESATADARKFTFENFIVNDGNQFAHAAARSVVDYDDVKPKRNPLFIYGESGSGKTHLLYAIENAIMDKIPFCEVAYFSGKDFADELQRYIDDNKKDEFVERIKSGIDILIIDDFQQIGASAPQLQKECFDALCARYGIGWQIVIAADRAPNDIAGLSSELAIFLESALLAEACPLTR